MMYNRKEFFCSDRTVIGTWVCLSDPYIIEFVKMAGYDFVCIDNENIPFDSSLLGQMIRVANNINIPVFVRIPRLEDIPFLVDFGADGIIVPDISLKRAKEAVEKAKYKPVGKRSLFGSFRAQRISGFDLKEYYQKANGHIALAVQIEDQEAMSDIDEILALEGIDIVASGRNDISQSLGFPCEPGHPKVLEFEDTVIKKSLQYGKIPVMIVKNKNDLAAMEAKGVRMIFSGRDEAFLLNAMRNNIANLKT